MSTKTLTKLLNPNYSLQPSWVNLFDYNPLEGILDNRYKSDIATHLPVNLVERDTYYQLDLIAAGFQKDDFKLSFENDRLTIACHREEGKDEKDEKQEYHLKEYHFSAFSRSFDFPEACIDESKIKAGYKEGILKITLPKRKEKITKPLTNIEIN